MRRLQILVVAMAFMGAAGLLSGCGADQKERDATWKNRQSINENIPVPQIAWSSRRYTLASYYGKILGKPRLRTCTMFTGRGGNTTGEDLLGIAETLGMPVNLSNQMTEPGISEPDSVYSGPNDQTVVVFRNGLAFVSEADSSGITGDCPPGLKPNTKFQQVLDYQSSQKPDDDVNFNPSDDELIGAGVATEVP